MARGLTWPEGSLGQRAHLARVDMMLASRAVSGLARKAVSGLARKAVERLASKAVGRLASRSVSGLASKAVSGLRGRGTGTGREGRAAWARLDRDRVSGASRL